MRPPVYLSHPASLAHRTGAHPERPERIVAIEEALSRRGWLGFERELSPLADDEALEAVHPRGYLERLGAASERGASLDPDTVVGPGSWEAALRSAGGAQALVDLLSDSAAETGISVHRPPGHHAAAARAMGFCLINNVAVAARRALDRHGLERVLILDWDVHHGNGTSDLFYDSAQVLYASIHESPLYPGTGSASELGAGEGLGYTVNMPVPAGSGDETFVALVERVVVPIALAFEPQLVLVSAGYDAHVEDPLGNCTVSEAGFRAMTVAMRSLCAELAIPLGIVLEGGYALGALARSVLVTMEALGRSPPVAGLAGVAAERRGGGRHPLVTAARERLADHWPSLTETE